MCKVPSRCQRSTTAGMRHTTIVCICFVGMLSSADTRQTALSCASFLADAGYRQLAYLQVCQLAFHLQPLWLI